jgi:hypothetical protein
MRTRALLVAVTAATVVLAGCGGSGHKKHTSSTAEFHLGAPKILTFSGPKVVSCAKKGQIKTVSYLYQTQYATSVEPEIDGQAPGAQAGYDPNGGHMRFAYTCRARTSSRSPPRTTRASRPRRRSRSFPPPADS